MLATRPRGCGMADPAGYVSGWAAGTVDVPVRYVGVCSQGHRVVGPLGAFDPARTREDFYTRGFYVTRCLDTRDDPRGCHATIPLKPIKVRAGKRECGPWCTDGTGRTCTCVCEGRNHGSKYSHTGALWHAR